MSWVLSELLTKCRKALDDISSSSDAFVVGVNAELTQALEYAAVQLCMTLPPEWFTPTSPTITTTSTLPSGTPEANKNYILGDGRGYIVLPSDYLRFISLKLTAWPLAVFHLLSIGGDEWKRQSTPWGWGTPSKPAASVEKNGYGQDILYYWTAPKINNEWQHGVEYCLYIPRPSISGTPSVLSCGLRAEAEMLLVYRACGIFLDGRKEHDAASRMYALSQVASREAVETE
jgi:hypothetical protein